jgi:Spx/MgsR family transcriptional regulator
MIKMYGINTCGSVRKAKQWFNNQGIEFEFVDLKKEPVGCDKIDEWLKKVEIKRLFNSRGTKYRTLKLKELNLDDAGKREWLCKENLLIKRPVIEFNDDVIVGFDEDEYNLIFR